MAIVAGLTGYFNAKGLTHSLYVSFIHLLTDSLTNYRPVTLLCIFRNSLAAL